MADNGAINAPAGVDGLAAVTGVVLDPVGPGEVLLDCVPEPSINNNVECGINRKYHSQPTW